MAGEDVGREHGLGCRQLAQQRVSGIQREAVGLLAHREALAADYMQLDFSKTTANAYLMRVAPLSGVRYCIEAQMPTPDIAAMLHIDTGQPCLVLRRKTLSCGQVAMLWHPANRYQFTGGF